MQFIKDRLNYLFNSTKGLILVAIAMIAVTTAIWGMLSGPMAEMGVREVVIKLFNMDMLQAEREGRIIILYHSIAMAVVAIETYMITSLLKLKSFLKTAINAIITVGYILTMIFGMGFAYFGHNWAFHGVYIFGLSLIFFAGVLLVIALWPWKKEYYQPDKTYAQTKKGVDIERIAFFATALTTVISALFGAIPGSFFGNGFEVFLAENIIRIPEKTTMEYSVIGHLHIMLALIAVMLTLIIGRWLNFKGFLHKLSMPLMILGTILLNLGVWGVATPLEPIAHMIIYTGATPSMVAALLLLIWSWNKLIKNGTRHLEKPKFGDKLKALVKDPLKFGPTWQMLFMNFTTSGLGIFMAVRLDEIFRVWPAREERIELTGHWHALSAIIATIILLYYGDIIGLKGKVRQLYGWGIILFSDIALAGVTAFEMKRLFITEAEQQPLVNGLMYAIDFGLGALLVLLAIVMVWRLIDLFKKKGKWTAEKEQELSEEVVE
ncbi:MAG: hypothetical protein CVU43_08505 [Chloroflexi bacterium HGW-Chloroflexi-5]|jgi:hypothetical protein|nr:MAG: hypothetical protein CVU43_08505 [Chloroflexi bacterium HGW-Chloroflexi-5]